MAVIDHIDLPTKHIYLAEGIRTYHPVDDIYKEIRELRRVDESARGFDIPVVASGNVAKGGGRYTPRLATFRHGWKIVPEDVSHVLFITGEQITDEGEAGPAAIDFDPLSESSKVIVQYEPPTAEVLVVSAPPEIPLEELAREQTVQDIRARTDTIEWEDIHAIRQIEQGGWKIDPATNQMIFYAADNITEVCRFDLYDDAGQPSVENVFERRRV